jgi:hypothetical protein
MNGLKNITMQNYRSLLSNIFCNIDSSHNGKRIHKYNISNISICAVFTDGGYFFK